MSSVLDRPQTSSAAVDRAPREALATGLLVDAVFGTSAGVVIRTLRSDVFGVTTVSFAPPRTTQQAAVADEVRTLRDAVAAAGVNKQQLAQLLGVDRRSLSGWVSGEIRPTSERLDVLRAAARVVAEIEAERPGRIDEVLRSSRGTTMLLDAVASGQTRLEGWRTWLARSESPVTVTARRSTAAPIWAAAAQALAEGRLRAPSWERTVRPESAYEMNPDKEAAAFIEPPYEGGRRDYR